MFTSWYLRFVCVAIYCDIWYWDTWVIWRNCFILYDILTYQIWYVICLMIFLTYYWKIFIVYVGWCNVVLTSDKTWWFYDVIRLTKEMLPSFSEYYDVTWLKTKRWFVTQLDIVQFSCERSVKENYVIFVINKLW